jgi:hypothetical protein
LSLVDKDDGVRFGAQRLDHFALSDPAQDSSCSIDLWELGHGSFSPMGNKFRGRESAVGTRTTNLAGRQSKSNAQNSASWLSFRNEDHGASACFLFTASVCPFWKQCIKLSLTYSVDYASNPPKQDGMASATGLATGTHSGHQPKSSLNLGLWHDLKTFEWMRNPSPLLRLEKCA